MTILEPFRARDEVPAFSRREPTLPGGNSFLRALTARAIASVSRRSVEQIVGHMWPSDLVTRAAVVPAMTSVAGWAAELAQKVVADGLDALGPASAGAELLKRGMVLTFDGAGSISAPGLPTDFSGNAAFIAEGAPIRVFDGALLPKTLNPHKLAAIAVLTREMVESSNAERVIGDALVANAGRSLDEVLFDANPEDATRPAGLRNGIAAITPSNNADFSEAYLEDLTTLFSALAPVAGNGPYVLIASPGRAAMMMRRAVNPLPNVIFLGSSAVVNDVLAVAPAALVSAFSPTPEVETSNAGTLHMEKTSPQPVGSASPHRSLFQTDSIALKMRWPCTWVLRDPRGFAWMTPAWK